MINYNEADKIRWQYNIDDVIYTREIYQQQKNMFAANSKLAEFHKFQQEEIAPALIQVMERGVRIDLDKKLLLQKQLTAILGESKDEEFQEFNKDSIKAKLEYLLGEPFNPKSRLQMLAVFKDLLGIRLVIDKKSHTESTASAYMLQYLQEYPEYRALISLILEYRSIGVFLRTFVSAKVDEDGRMRTAYNCAGTKTYRLSSRKNAFGFGANLANIPSKGKIDLKYSLAEIEELEDNDNEETSIEDTIEGITELPNCKEFFIPDEGFTFWNADYSGADAMIVAWDSDCEWLKNFFLTSKEKLYIYIASHFYQREITTKDKEYKIFKQFCHGCVTADHEVLTQEGWKFIDSFNLEKDKLAVWNPENKDIWFEKPNDFNIDWVSSEEDLYELEGDSFSFLGTQDHKFPYMLSSGKISKQEASKLNPTARIPYSGNLVDGKYNPEKALVQLIVALQADGHVQYEDKNEIGTFMFHFHKERKQLRLISILEELKVDYKQSPDKTKIWFKGTLEPFMKHPSWWMLNFSQEAISIFVDELKYWDGSEQESYLHKRTSITTVNKLMAEVYSTLIHLNGKASKVSYIDRDETRQRLYRVSINNRNFYRTETGKRGNVKHNGTWVFCPQTSTGFFLIRRKGNIYVTGNTNYGMQEAKAALNAGIPIKDAKKIRQWYFGLCPEILSWHKRIESDVKTKGYVENIFGARGWFLNKDSATLMNQAIAWIPQSSIAILVNHGLVNIEKNEKDIQVLLQVHDALAGQFRNNLTVEEAKNKVEKHMLIELPYPEPLVIPVDFSYSPLSYGGCK